MGHIQDLGVFIPDKATVWDARLISFLSIFKMTFVVPLPVCSVSTLKGKTRPNNSLKDDPSTVGANNCSEKANYPFAFKKKRMVEAAAFSAANVFARKTFTQPNLH